MDQDKKCYIIQTNREEIEKVIVMKTNSEVIDLAVAKQKPLIGCFENMGKTILFSKQTNSSD